VPYSETRERQALKTAGTKMRVDLLLFDGGHAPSIERARALILAGRVLVGEQKIDKPGARVPADSIIRLLGVDPPYVSRGGLKLAAALEHWEIAVTGRACLDVGASTGGFTDCLLQNGAAKVTAVDTGFGQIAMKLRNDPRVRLLERTNARLLEPGSLLAVPGSPQLTFLAMDVSFVSAASLLGPVLAAAPALAINRVSSRVADGEVAHIWLNAPKGTAQMKEGSTATPVVLLTGTPRHCRLNISPGKEKLMTAP